jgi:hypothetical protein
MILHVSRHDELVSKDGVYASMWSEQLKTDSNGNGNGNGVLSKVQSEADIVTNEP